MSIGRRYGKGDLYAVTVVKESEYGTADAEATPEHAGEIISLKIDTGVTFEEQACPGCRRGPMFKTGEDITANVDFRSFGPEALLAWLKWTLGETAGGDVAGLNEGTPTSRTASFRIAPTSTDRLTGAYVNKLTIKSGKLGDKLDMSAELYAKGYVQDLDEMGTDLPHMTPLRSRTGWRTTSENVPGLEYAGEWTLTITQGLEKVPGVAEDGTSSASGQEPYLGAPEIILEIVLPAKNRVLDVLKYTRPDTIWTLETDLGTDYKLIVEAATLLDDATQRGQDPYTETMKLNASNVVIDRRR